MVAASSNPIVRNVPYLTGTILPSLFLALFSRQFKNLPLGTETRYRESKEVELSDADEYRLLWRRDAKDLLHDKPQEEEKKAIRIVEKVFAPEKKEREISNPANGFSCNN
jgi:hypothetical protein